MKYEKFVVDFKYANQTFSLWWDKLGNVIIVYSDHWGVLWSVIDIK